MTNVRVLHNKDNPYAQINRKNLQNPKLTWEARGLWAYLLSLPGDWSVNVKHLVSQSPGGIEKLYRILNELKDNELCYLFQRHKKNGKWETAEYLIAESPEKLQEELEELKKSLPQRENPCTVIPDAAKPDVYKEEILQKNNKKRKDIPKGISKSAATAADPPSPFSSDVEKLCEHLRSRVLGHGIKIKDPKESKTTWNNWIREMEKLLRIDGKSYEEVKKIIDYSHDDPFWCKNILSASKLRKQYDRLLFQWKDPKKRIINNKSTTYALRKELKKDKDYFIVMENYCKDSRKDLVIFFDQESKDFCLKLKKLFPWASFEVNNEFI